MNRSFYLLFLAVPILAVLSLSNFCQTQGDHRKVTSEEQLKEDVSSGPCKNKERLEAAKKLFQKMGATESDIQIEKYGDLQNLVLTKQGKSTETIIVGAHYDKVSDGCGTIDNWSGIVILAHLFRALGQVDMQKTYKFIAFDSEESGLLGSKAMVKKMPKESRASVCSMVNLDSFGLGAPFILQNASSAKMTEMAKELGAELKWHVNIASIPGADADSSSFVEKDIPAITISGLTDKWQDYLHSSKDKIDNVIPASLTAGYSFTLLYLGRVDGKSCDAFRKK